MAILPMKPLAGRVIVQISSQQRGTLIMWITKGRFGRGILLLLSLAGCSGGTGDGGKTAKLTGVVLDQGQPVGRALVYVEGYRSSTSLSDFTDSAGRFTLTGVPTGNFVIIAEATIGSRFLRGETPLLRVVGGRDQSIGEINLQPIEGSQFKGAISGYVLDSSGDYVIGATVLVEGESPSRTARTGVQGGFLIRDVTPGMHSLTAAVVDQQGRRWQGRRDEIWVAPGETTTNANLVVAPQGQTGTLVGQVTDTQGQPVKGAVITAGLSYDPDRFPLIHLTATTDRRGDYRLAEVPIMPDGIVLTASAADFENQTVTVRDLTAGGTKRYNFRLREVVSTVPAAPRNLDILALTYPRDPDWTGNPARLYEPIRRASLQHFTDARSRRWLRALPELTAQAARRSATRRPPSGILIEVDVFWDPVEDDDLAGYRLYRSLFPLQAFVPVADLPGPTGWVGADISDDLSVETRYYYSVTSYSLRRNAESLLSSSVTAVPLPPLELEAPPSGPFGVSERPLFEWNPVRGATQYTVIIFQDFPSTSLARQVAWGDGAEERVVRAPSTSVRYDGNQLVPGEDYFWVVIADQCPSGQGNDPACSPVAQSFSAIWTFMVEE